MKKLIAAIAVLICLNAIAQDHNIANAVPYSGGAYAITTEYRESIGVLNDSGFYAGSPMGTKIVKNGNEHQGVYYIPQSNQLQFGGWRIEDRTGLQKRNDGRSAIDSNTKFDHISHYYPLQVRQANGLHFYIEHRKMVIVNADSSSVINTLTEVFVNTQENLHKAYDEIEALKAEIKALKRKKK